MVLILFALAAALGARLVAGGVAPPQPKERARAGGSRPLRAPTPPAAQADSCGPARPAIWMSVGWMTAATVALGVFGVALGARLFAIRTSYELFFDELAYADVAQSIAAGQGLDMFGDAFYLHPPLVPLILSIASVVGVDGANPLVEGALTGRAISAVCGATTVAAVAFLLARFASVVIALLVALVMTFDAFVNRFDSRFLLEAPAMAFSTLGVVFFLAASVRGGGLRRYEWILVGGLFGLAVLSKDTAAFVTLLPLWLWVIAGLTTAAIAMRITAASALLYASYLAAVTLSGGLPEFLGDKTSGVRRLLGVETTTGFNVEGTPAISERVLANLDLFAVTYTIILVASAVAAWCIATLVLRGVRAEPMRGDAVLLPGASLWLASALLLLVYSTAFGTIEEQMFYFLAVPSFMVVGLGLGHAIRHREAPALVAVVVAALVLAIGWSGLQWVETRTGRDDGYRQLLAWSEASLDPSATISTTEETANFFLRDVRVVELSSPAAIRAEGVDYVLVSTRLVDEGYALARPSLVRWLDENGEIVFIAEGRSSGELRVYQVSDRGDETAKSR